MNERSKYKSPFSVSKRQTVFIDPSDPRVRGWKAGLTAARLGAELEIVDASSVSRAGLIPYIKGSVSSSPSSVKNFDPLNPEQGAQPEDITNLSAYWSDTTLVITFDFDLTSEQNKYVQGFKYTLTSDGVESLLIPSNILNTSSTEQTIEFTAELNERYFGEFATSFSLLEVFAYDTFGNVSSTITLSVIPSYTTDLPAPTIMVTAINQGYTVDWNAISESYRYISIEEIISDASTAPLSGYSGIYLDSIKPATIITSTLETRWVKARFTNRAGYGPYSTAYKVTPESPVIVDNTPPPAPESGSVTAGIDNSAGATIGFNAYIDISWSGVSDLTLKGYRIRFRESGTSNPYSYVDSPGTGTTFRLTGLSIGTTYEIGIASYDEFNNTTGTYTSLGTAQATGTPFIGKNVTTVGYFGASATGDTGTFKFGYGVQDSGGAKRGLVFNSNNYWYIDSAQSASLKAGGTDNYISWDGSTFIVQGDLRAKAGNFQGNVQIISGGSIYSGTLSGNNLSGAGFILNNSGLTFSSASVPGTTTIDGTSGLFTTQSANIGGWLISPETNPNSIYQTLDGSTIKLDSSDRSISVSGTGYSAGFGLPDASDIVFWAGSRSASGNFYITKNGTLNALEANLRGALRSGDPQYQSVMRFGKAGPSDPGADGIYINNTNYWYATAHFSLGGGKLTGTSNSLTIAAGTQIYLNATSNEDGTFGDSTLVQSEGDGFVTIGRAFFFGGQKNPNVSANGTDGSTLNGLITKRSHYTNALGEVGSQGTSAFNVGDIWLQRV